MLSSHNRLKENADFRNLFRRGKRVETGLFGLVASANGLEGSRFGLVVRKAFGRAVDRNRAKRRGRHLLRGIQDRVHPPCDMVFLPRAGFLKEEDALLKEKLEEAVLKLGFLKK
ncbi:MAG TPA: ribonuclease P protein component [Nitrospiria bacterium]